MEQDKDIHHNEQPIGWTPGDKWRHKEDDIGDRIGTELLSGNRYTIYWGEDHGESTVSIEMINRIVAAGHWIIQPKEPVKVPQYSGYYSVTDANCVITIGGSTLTEVLEKQRGHTIDIYARLRYLEQPYLHYVDEQRKHNNH